MIQISVDEMKRDLPVYLHRVEAGETLVIVKAGKPVAEMKPITLNSIDSTSKKLRPFGLCAGEFTVPDDFNEPLPERIIAEFEGR
ncbi:MAG: type II toxin-antitoxin system prevent-host-death family antitoxin [candidate division KSB1 bacterium]|nr:type II toxin-antitoxin system prevent-host-death family antitoxin [candidate division KSB1 bacterium]MDZ7368812.1 type II toxin-antitoxin system prevent-host-death family antitoxin [candidate division KSB1 bacterium]MDZ7406656.1 type II toxin-antitoxin system prevent-host-death family antitoxin [candidate division KSB1 bacterium]